MRTMGRARIAAAAVLLAAVVLFPLLPGKRTASAATGSNDVIANLWMWPWPSVAGECTNVLGPKGYGAVQVAPPEDSISVSGHPWWDVYQPAAYDLNSRLGTRSQFIAMVSACHTAGVKVYVDAVINHMTGANQVSTTSYGGAVFTNNYSYPSAGYTSSDFHFYPANCPNSDNQIHNWGSQTDVQECQLVNLSDLYTENDHVRTKIAGYLNDLIGIGVDGFRVDAAKHMNVNDLVAIKAKLTASPFWFQEVMPGGSGGLAMSTYEQTGSLLEFNYATDLKNQFTGNIANLQTFGQSWGLEPSAKSVVFVENHDTERNGSTLSYKSGATDTLANIFMLGWNFGTPNVMSSFDFNNNDQSPPADANGYVTAVTCGSGWVCQHRDRGVANMVAFHNAARADATVSNWYTDGSNLIAFSRGPASGSNGWLAINNENGVQTRTFATGLAAGTYCDIIHGDVSGNACTGPTVTVDASGNATVSVAAKDAVALYPGSRVSQTTSPTPTASQVSETFTVSGAPTNAPIYLVGSIAALGNWAPANAIPLRQNGSTWTATVGGLPASTYVEYKYIAKDSNGNVTWEPGSNMHLTTPAGGAGSVTDVWTGSSSTVSATFNATVTTWLGQNVYVVGSVPALGSWNTANAVALSPANYPVWTATVALPPNTALEYKFIKKNPDGTVEWEADPNRTYTSGSSGSVTLSGTWQGTASSVVSVTFKENATTTPGQNVYVVGSINALGGWDTSKAIALSSATYPVWAVTLTVPGSTSFEYKYVKKNSDGSITWESGTNRAYTTGGSGSVTLNDAWK